MKRKALTLLILLGFLIYWFFSAPLIVSVSFDVERDPPAANLGKEGFKGVEEIPVLLDILDRHGVKGTFFVTGRVVELYPEVVLQISEQGHEVAVHGGYRHDDALSGLSMKEQLLAINRTASSIQSATGIPPKGYRAPGHRISPETMTALETLGFAYDSSAVPSLTGMLLYGHSLHTLKGPYHPGANDIFSQGDMSILEVPITPVFLNGNLDSLLAYQGEAVTGLELFFKAVDCRMKRRPLVIYLHPGHMVELPGEPRNYRTGSRILCGLDRMLGLLDLIGAEYVRLDEVAKGS